MSGSVQPMKVTSMPKSECLTYGNIHEWIWEEAFDKFGFNDGESQVMTQEVVKVLENAGYDVRSWQWGIHNEIIIAIAKDGVPLIPASAKSGYDDPRKYLPPEIVALLDSKLPEDEVLAS